MENPSSTYRTVFSKRNFLWVVIITIITTLIASVVLPRKELAPRQVFPNSLHHELREYVSIPDSEDSIRKLLLRKHGYHGAYRRLDASPFVILYISGSSYCGSAGCRIDILLKSNSNLRWIDTIPRVYLPIGINKAKGSECKLCVNDRGGGEGFSESRYWIITVKNLQIYPLAKGRRGDCSPNIYPYMLSRTSEF